MDYRRSLLWRFVKSYILVLVLPLAIGFYTYYQGVAIVEEDTYSILETMLGQTVQSVEQSLAEMETLSMQIANNQTLTEMAYQSTVNGDTILNLDRCIKEINKYFLPDAKVAGCYVYYRNSDYIMTRETLYRTELYYSHVLQYRPELYGEWLDLLDGVRVPGEFVSLGHFYQGPEEENPYIAFVTSIPFNINLAPQASLVLLYDKNDIAGEFVANSDSTPSLFYVMEEEGSFVVASPEIQEEWLEDVLATASEGRARLEGQNGNMVSISHTGQKSGFTYGYLKLENHAFGRLRGFRNAFLAVAVLGMLAGVACLLVISYRNSQPVYRLMERLEDYDGSQPPEQRGDAYAIIEQGIGKLIDSREDLKSGLERQTPMVKAAFTQNLLRGLLHSEQEALAQAQLLGMEPGIPSGLYQVALFRLDSPDSHGSREALYSARTALVGRIEQALSNLYFIHHLDYRTLAVALHFASENDARKQLEAFVAQVSDNLPCRVGVGGAYGRISEIWYSFDQAQLCLNVSAAAMEPLLFYADRAAYSDQIYYSIKVEQNLVNRMKTRDWDSAEQLLNTLYNENYQKRLLSIPASTSLLEQLKGTMLRAADNRPDQSLEDILEQITPSIQPEHAFRYLKQACKQIISADHSGKGQADTVAESLRSYIEENYMLASLNLPMAAGHFNLSEGYFSMLFKDHIGIPFTDYVETVRIQKATILLEDTKLTINEISMLCGYGSVQSFRRAFKRVTGQSPSALRC